MVILSDYYRPANLDEAVRYAQLPGSIALAGGALAFSGIDLPYEHFIDLQDIANLKRIEVSEAGVYLGSTVTLQMLVESNDIPQALTYAITRTLPLNIRNGTSVGESLIVPNPPREWLTILTALNAEVEQLTSPGQPLTSLLASLVEKCDFKLLASSIITRIFVPFIRPGEALGTAFVARTPADEPIVNAAVFIRLGTNNRIETALAAVGGASECPVMNIPLTIAGHPLDESSIRGAVELVASEVDPVPDYKGSVAYRREMAAVCVRRAMLECIGKLDGGNAGG